LSSYSTSRATFRGTASQQARNHLSPLSSTTTNRRSRNNNNNKTMMNSSEDEQKADGTADAHELLAKDLEKVR
jgi:hypothetical protein